MGGWWKKLPPGKFTACSRTLLCTCPRTVLLEAPNGTSQVDLHTPTDGVEKLTDFRDKKRLQSEGASCIAPITSVVGWTEERVSSGVRRGFVRPLMRKGAGMKTDLRFHLCDTERG